jgi:hypothetical protein
MNHRLFALYSGVGVAALASYVVLDHFVLGVALPPGPPMALIRVAGILACLAFVSNALVKRGLADLRAQQAAAHVANMAPATASKTSVNTVQENDAIRFVYSRRYVMWGWASLGWPVGMLGYSILEQTGVMSNRRSRQSEGIFNPR